MKKFMVVLLALVMVFGMSVSVFAENDEPVLPTLPQFEDGRNGNGIGTGTIVGVVISEGSYTEEDAVLVGYYYLNELVDVDLSNVLVSIDGDVNTLKYFVNGVELTAAELEEMIRTIELDEEGNFFITVYAATYFKNGKKAGLVHSTTELYFTNIEVEEARPEPQIPVEITVVSATGVVNSRVVHNSQQDRISFTATVTLSNQRTGTATFTENMAKGNTSQTYTKSITIDGVSYTFNVTVNHPLIR